MDKQSKQILEKHDIELRVKPDYKNFYHAFLFFIVKTFFFLAWLLTLETFDKNFDKDFWNYIGGVIYTSSRVDFENWGVFEKSILYHELAHFFDSEKEGLWFDISYVCLPFLRWKWEARAYCIQMLIFYHEKGFVPDKWPDYFSDSLSSASYFWCVDKNKALHVFKNMQKEIEQGNIPKTANPNDEEFMNIFKKHFI